MLLEDRGRQRDVSELPDQLDTVTGGELVRVRPDELDKALGHGRPSLELRGRAVDPEVEVVGPRPWSVPWCRGAGPTWSRPRSVPRRRRRPAPPRPLPVDRVHDRLRHNGSGGDPQPSVGRDGDRAVVAVLRAHSGIHAVVNASTPSSPGPVTGSLGSRVEARRRGTGVPPPGRRASSRGRRHPRQHGNGEGATGDPASAAYLARRGQIARGRDGRQVRQGAVEVGGEIAFDGHATSDETDRLRVVMVAQERWSSRASSEATCALSSPSEARMASVDSSIVSSISSVSRSSASTATAMNRFSTMYVASTM